MHVVSLIPGTRRTAMLVLGVLVAVGPLLLGARPARAATTFTVNRASDQPDRSLNDGVCDIDPARGSQCTLRAAIQEANASDAADTIEFDIPGFGVHTIKPTTRLPTIIQTVTIDGYSQPGSSPNTATTGTNAQLRIELNGTDVSNARRDVPGLVIRRGADGTVVRGLVINRFDSSGVRVVSERGAPPVRGVSITGNFIGTNPGGTISLPNGFGVDVAYTAATTVGGSAPEDCNLISGNTTSGVGFLGSVASGNAVQGNLIGTQRDGRSMLGNGYYGIIAIDTANLLTIGGDVAGAANTIAYNGADGIEILGLLPGNRVLRNAIFANGGIGIDHQRSHAQDGPTPNDPGDADSGPNNYQNFPVITSALTADGATTIRGRLNSTPNRSFLIQVFSDPAGDEGKVFRGETQVQTNASGNATFAVRSDHVIPASHNVTTTATGDDGTSEFSPPVPVT